MYNDPAYLAGFGEILRQSTAETGPFGGAVISGTGPVFGGAINFGTVTLTTYTRKNMKTLLGWDVRLTLPEENKAFSELNTSNYRPGEPFPRVEQALKVLLNHESLIHEALQEDHRTIVRRIYDAIFN